MRDREGVGEGEVRRVGRTGRGGEVGGCGVEGESEERWEKSSEVGGETRLGEGVLAWCFDGKELDGGTREVRRERESTYAIQSACCIGVSPPSSDHSPSDIR